MSRDLVTTSMFSTGAPGKLRVLFVTNMWPTDERPFYGSFIRSQAGSLASQGHAVDVVYIQGFRSKLAYVRAVRDVRNTCRAGRYDLAHVHYGHSMASSLALPRMPTVFSYCGEDLLGAPRANGITLKSRVEVQGFRQLARRATRTITKSHEMEQKLPRSVRVRNVVLPNGVDLDQFRPRDRDQARRSLGWAQEGRVALFLGNPDDPRKNVGLAREAVSLVRRRLPDVRLVEAWKVPADSVPAVMNAANCLVFPSRSEGSPNAIKEAMASALPIVATDVGDIRERLSGVGGCFVREPTPEAFASAIEQAMSIGGADAARIAAAEVGIDRIAARLEALYYAAIEDHRRQHPEGQK